MVQELLGNSTVADLLERTSKEDDALVVTVGGFWEAARPKVNHKEVDDFQQKLKMGDLVELQPCMPGKSLNEYRDKLRRMYDDCSMQNLRSQSKLPRVRLSEAVVF